MPENNTHFPLTSEDFNELCEILMSKKRIKDGQAEPIAHALWDISESISKIYTEIVPKIMESKGKPDDDFWEILHDLSFEFQHIQYYINDSKLTEL